MAITIHQWLKSSRDYKTGVELYEQYGESAVLLKMFRTAENSFTIKKLAEELGKLSALPFDSAQGDRAQQFDAPPQLRTRSAEPPSQNSSPSRENNFPHTGSTPDSPPQVQELELQQQKLYRERDYMRASLPKSDKELRRKYCLKIMENTYEIDRIWKVLDHFRATGEVLSLEEEDRMNDKSLYEVDNRIRNARANVSKAKKKGKQELLDKWTEKLNELMAIKSKLLQNAVQ